MDTNYDDWEPPSEATLKLLQARRERSDKISKLMGDYLLKGYKMLGVTCPQCDTILMQTKQGTNYCIACSELDSDADKDDPVTNQTAALALAREREVRDSTSRASAAPRPSPPSAPSATTRTLAQPVLLTSFPQPNENYTEVSSTYVTPDLCVLPSIQHAPESAHCQSVNLTANASSCAAGSFGEGEKYVKELLDKMDWATAELRGTQSVEYSIQLCQLIKGCAEAVTSVKAALTSRN